MFVKQDKLEGKVICLPESKFHQEQGYEFVGLEPGNYSARVRVISLAGEGPWTPPFIFTVPEPAIGSYHLQ